MLCCHALGLKNHRDVSLQPFQKKRTSNGAPAQRPTKVAVSLAGLHRRANEPTIATGCPKR